jgi:VCBS repeat-containing protein
LITLSATDPNGSNLSFTITGSPAHGAITNIGAPSCSLSGGVSTCTVNVTYTSNSGYSGPDTFSFRASNGVQNSNAATVNVTVNPGNRPPVATDSSITTNEDTSVPVPLQASDPDGNALTYVILSGPANGMLTGIGSSRTYLPNPNYNGADSFTFKVNDGAVDSNTATVSITINSVNDPPVAANDSYSIVAGLMLSVGSPGVLSNDSDIDSSSLNAIVDAGPSHGTLTLNANGSFNYLPNPGYVGSDNFTYHANDGVANSGPATVVITVSAPECVNHPSDLVAWYPANGNVFDVMGGNHATLQNGATFAAGMVGQAFDLNNDGNATNQASSDIVRVPRTSSLEPQRLSVDAWVYARSYLWDSEGGVIISKDTVGTSAGAGASYALIGPGTTQKFNAYVRFTDGTQPRIISAHAFALNQWHHVLGPKPEPA